MILFTENLELNATKFKKEFLKDSVGKKKLRKYNSDLLSCRGV